MSIYKDNEQLLNEWEIASINNKEEADFVHDGILYRGKVIYINDGWKHEPGNEEELWENSSKRILYITKELYDGEGGDAWDIRCETCRKNETGENTILLDTRSRFTKNYPYLTYGLANITANHYIDFDGFSDEDAIQNFDNCTLARINVKKQYGNAKINDSTLVKYINKYSNLLKQQILLLDADIIVSCGGKIFNFLRDSCYNLERINDWIYYDASLNKVIINSWHLSYFCISYESFYTQMMEAYYEFLQNHPHFLNPKR